MTQNLKLTGITEGSGVGSVGVYLGGRSEKMEERVLQCMKQPCEYA